MVWKNKMFPEISKVAKFRIPIEKDLFLRQCASGENLFHLPSSYRYETGTIAGYITRLNWNEEFVILEKEQRETFEYFIVDRRIESVKGPLTKDRFKMALSDCEIADMTLKGLAELDWIINF